MKQVLLQKPFTDKTTFDYILGNPPFVGKQLQNEDTKSRYGKSICWIIKVQVFLDYVTAWYIKAASLFKTTKTKVAFVSTNSISQGEQAGLFGIFFLISMELKFILHIEHLNGLMKQKVKQQCMLLLLVLQIMIQKRNIYLNMMI